MFIQISQIDHDYGFDENDIIESHESFMETMREILDTPDYLNKCPRFDGDDIIVDTSS